MMKANSPTVSVPVEIFLGTTWLTGALVIDDLKNWTGWHWPAGVALAALTIAAVHFAVFGLRKIRR